MRGKTRKYETPFGQTNQLDIPPAIRNQLLDRERPLWFCESTRKADSAAQRGLCAVGMNGVNGWMHTCPITKDKVPLPELKHIPVNDRDVVIALDNDIETNMSVTKAALGLARILAALAPRCASCTSPTMARRPAWTTTCSATPSRI